MIAFKNNTRGSFSSCLLLLSVNEKKHILFNLQQILDNINHALTVDIQLYNDSFSENKVKLIYIYLYSAYHEV